jgi:hypothetical protein
MVRKRQAVNGPSITYKITRLFRLFRFYTETESFDVSIEPKQTEDHPKPFDREHIWYFSENLGFVSVCFGLFRNSVCFSCFDIGSKHRNKPKQIEFFYFWCHETNRNTTETDLVSVCFGSIPNFFCLFRGHPTSPAHQ